MCCNWHVSPHKLADREGVAALALDPGGTIAINYGQVQLSAVFPLPTLSLPSDVSLSLSYLFLLCRKKPSSLSETRTPNNNEPIAETGERESNRASKRARKQHRAKCHLAIGRTAPVVSDPPL